MIGPRRRRRGTVALLVGLVLGVALPLAPVGPAGAAPRFPTRPTRVLLLGDSVIKGAAPVVPGLLPGREVVADAEVSRSTGATAAAAASYGTDWDVVVILVAHNDGGSPAAYQPAYRRMLDQFAGVPRLVLLTLHEVRPYYATVNAFLRAEAAARPNVRVADWNAACAANPGSTGGDGLHLTGSGARVMAALVADEVARAELEAAPPPTTTTLPPTTTAPPTTVATTTSTTVAVSLIPATSVVREPSTTTSTTEIPPVSVLLSATRPDPGGDRGQDTPAWVWAVLALGAVALGAVLHRHRGTLPR